MFRRIRGTIFWLKALWAYYAGDFIKSRRLYNKYASIYRPRRFECAFDATLKIQEGRYAEARNQFKDVLSAKPDSSDQNNKYIDLYCKYYIALSEKTSSIEFLKSASECKPTRNVWRALPLDYSALSFTMTGTATLQ